MKNFFVLSLCVVALVLVGCSSGGSVGGGGSPTPVRTTVPTPTVVPTGLPTGVPPLWGHQTKTVNCNLNAVQPLPDPACTPGAILPVTAVQVCVPGYSSGVRNVPTAEKDQARAEYGVVSNPPGAYEIDHFIALELGGSNDISNLWPEAAQPMPGFHQKDAVENYLHSQVCSGKMTLLAAQLAISRNWLAVYQSMPPAVKEDIGGGCDITINPDC